MSRLIQRRFVEPLLSMLRLGITPEKIAASLALGLVLGVFPALGTTTILCTTAALLLRLNFPAIQMANFVAYPLQLIFFIPFIRLGERAFGVAPGSITLAEVAAMIRTDAWLAIHQLWTTTMHAIAVWAAISVPATVALYFLFLSLLRTLRSRREQFATRSEYLPQTPIGPDASSGGAA
jgi:uncharacterized protein (DUF2062 family)